MSVLHVDAPANGTSTMILLHGMTESSAKAKFIAHELQLRPSLKHINFVLPNSPYREVTVFKGQSVQAWFDTTGVGVTDIEQFTNDGEGVDESLKMMEDLIDEEVRRGIPRDRIVVGGFSSGAAITLALAIASKHKLAGFISLSGFIPAIKHLEAIAQPVNRDTPLLVVNGTADKEVPFVTAEVGLKLLRNRFLFTNVNYKVFEGMLHRVGPESLEVTGDFLETILR